MSLFELDSALGILMSERASDKISHLCNIIYVNYIDIVCLSTRKTSGKMFFKML